MDSMESESWVDKTGEWRTRKVSIMGVVQSFISQLKIGEDLTRVSLPAIMLYPFSMIEVIASRELSTFELLENLNNIPTPLERMLTINAWMISGLPMEVWRKKPYNPVLGEIHETYIESRNGYGNTYLVGEQVSHHPPITAVHVYNRQEQIILKENLSFGVTFGGNKVSIITNGAGTIRLEKLNETYEMPKKIPDMSVRQLILGTKRIFWEGNLTVTCKESGLVSFLNFMKSGNDNVVKVTIQKDKEVLCVLEGLCGGQLSVAIGKEKKKPLLELDKIYRSRLRYLPINELDPYSSQKIWANVSKYILEEKTLEADEAKKRVEENQRKQIAMLNSTSTPFNARYFEKGSDGSWNIKDVLLNSPKFGGTEEVFLTHQFSPISSPSNSQASSPRYPSTEGK